jgi:hypothetical protein
MKQLRLKFISTYYMAENIKLIKSSLDGKVLSKRTKGYMKD